MEPGNPESLHGTGSQKNRMAVLVQAVSTPRPHSMLSSYGLITDFVVDKEIFFQMQMCVVDDRTRGGVNGVRVIEMTRVCLTVLNHHQVANDNQIIKKWCLSVTI